MEVGWPMRLLHVAAAFSVSGAVGTCSPYVYKNEVQGFATGVGALDQGYTGGLRSIGEGRGAAYNVSWLNGEPVVALSPDCDLASGTIEPPPCSVINPSSKGDDKTAGPGPFERAAEDQASKIEVLADYADAL